MTATISELRQTPVTVMADVATHDTNGEEKILPSHDRVETSPIVPSSGSSSIFDDAEDDVPLSFPSLEAAYGLASLSWGERAPSPSSTVIPSGRALHGVVTPPPPPPLPSEWLLAQQRKQLTHRISQQDLIVKLALLARAEAEAALPMEGLLRNHREIELAATSTPLLQTPALSQSLDSSQQASHGLIDLSRPSLSGRSRAVEASIHSEIDEEDLRETDVICGRGGKSNHWFGNKRYRQVISETRQNYRGIPSKNDKTAMSEAIVDLVNAYGGRFLKRNPKSGRYREMGRGEARKKAAQALRETKTLKWTVEWKK